MADPTAPGPGAPPVDASGASEGAALPQVRVVRGAPDELEVAALVAGLAAVAQATEPDDVAPVEEWTNRVRGMRGNSGTAKSFGGRSGRHNADAWRWSFRA